MTEKLDGKCESLKKDDIGVHLVKDFLFKPDLTACKVYLKIIIETIIHVPKIFSRCKIFSSQLIITKMFEFV